jgi:5-methylthioadenosine/S-adenosylhomocysteine deaminase
MPAKMKFNLPLVNAHTHAAMVAFRGLAEDMPLEEWLNKHIFPAEQKHVNAVFVYRQTKKAIREMQKNGIKIFCDNYFFEGEVARAAKELNMPAVISEAILDFPTPSAKNPQQALAITERLIIKYQRDPLISVAVAPHSIYTASPRTLVMARALADKYGALYHVHLAETRTEFEDCLKKHKLTPVAYLEKLGVLGDRTLLAHCVWLTDKDINILARRKVSVVHCPLSNLKLGSGIAPIAKLVRAGVNVALGTDGAASSNRLDVWEAAKIAALLQKGISNDPRQLPAREAVQMATLNGIKALGIKKIGEFTRQDIETMLAGTKDFSFLYALNAGDINFCGIT